MHSAEGGNKDGKAVSWFIVFIRKLTKTVKMNPILYTTVLHSAYNEVLSSVYTTQYSGLLRATVQKPGWTEFKYQHAQMAITWY